jgi:hypothetical protein
MARSSPRAFLMPWGNLDQRHLGLLMLGAGGRRIMLGFPTRSR